MKDLLIKLSEMHIDFNLSDLSEFEKCLMFDLEWINEKGLTKVGFALLEEYEMLEE